MTEASNIRTLGYGITAVRADNPGALTLTGTQTYVIGNEHIVILDPGPADPVHLDRIQHVVDGRTVEAVYLTHAHSDHSAAADLATHRWAPLRASAETLSRLNLQGVPLVDEETIALSKEFTLRALNSPGHSGDHLSYFVESTRDLFTGDLVLGEGSTMIAAPDGSVRAYFQSLAKLSALQPGRLIPGHGPVVDAASERIEESRVHRLKRIEQVIMALQEGADSVESIRQAIYSDLPVSHHVAANLTIRAYLEYLAEEGHKLPILTA